MKRLIVVTVAIIATLFAGIGLNTGPEHALADGVASVSCSGDTTGLDDCTITLNSAIGPGGSFTGTLSGADASIIECNSIPRGGTCSHTGTSVTFYCGATFQTSNCTAGAQFRDVVQVGGTSGDSQTFSPSATNALINPTYYPSAGCGFSVVSSGCQIGIGALPSSNSFFSPSFTVSVP